MLPGAGGACQWRNLRAGIFDLLGSRGFAGRRRAAILGNCLHALNVNPPDTASVKTLITGANGHLGRRLIAALAPQQPVVALVRSAAAAQALTALARPNLSVRVLDYTDVSALSEAANGCDHAVHLVGIIKAGRDNSYAQAHEATTRALIAAAADCQLRSIVYLSILGAGSAAMNECLASKGRAERLLARGATPSLVLRLPMVLGEGDYAARALRQRARSNVSVLLRGSSKEQPIYAGDVVSAIVNALARPQSGHRVLDLAGPTALSRAALTRRVAALLGGDPRLLDLPLALGMAAAGLLERLLRQPPVTRAMLGVLDHDDDIDPRSACAVLGIRLMPLDEMLHKTVVAVDRDG